MVCPPPICLKRKFYQYTVKNGKFINLLILGILGCSKSVSAFLYEYDKLKFIIFWMFARKSVNVTYSIN